MCSLWRLDSRVRGLDLWGMDCHALSCAKARNDDKKVDSSLKSPAVGFGSLCLFFLPLRDSKILGLESTFGNAKNVSKPAKDSRIVDEKAGLRRLLRGDKT